MSAKQEATYHGADIVTRLRAYGPESDYDGVMQEAAQEIEKLREGFTELAVIARDWDGESRRANVFGNDPELDPGKKERALQRAMLLHHHAAAVEGCIDRAGR